MRRLSSTPFRHPPQTSATIADEFRRRIVAGSLAPGARFPTQQQVRRETGAAAATVQRIYHMLARDGFIVSRGTAGTIVASNPPHLCRYGIVFPDSPLAKPPDGTFVSVLARHAQALVHRRVRDIEMFFDIDGHTDVPDYRRIVQDIKMHRLAGLILVTNPAHLVDTPLLKTPGLPRVALGADKWKGIPVVTTDIDSWQDLALEYLASKGRTRVATVDIAFSPQWFARLHAKLAARGLLMRPHWRLQAHATLPIAVRNPVQLLMESRERPDAILVVDDIFVEDVLMGIDAVGLRVPDDVEIVSHCNLPLASTSLSPVRHLGFPVDAMLEKALDAIDQQRMGRKAEAMTAMAAQFEENGPGTHVAAPRPALMRKTWKKTAKQKMKPG